MKNICVIGVGYVGLTTGTCFADMGNYVCAVDISEERIENLRKSIMPIYEPGLKEMAERNIRAGRLTFTTSYAEGLKEAEFVFICVGTPEGVDGEADLQYVRLAAETIAQTMDHPLIVINKSTVPVGTGDWVSQIITENQPRPIPFSVVSCPEFLREGSALRDFQNPDRTVLGSIDRDAAHQVAQLYMPLRAPIVVTDLRTAEMIKYASNAFLATRISFINEIANICEALGADVKEVAQGMGYDKRIGHSFLEAGVGYGGSCFEGGETVFIVKNDQVVAQTLESLFAESGEPFAGDQVEVITPSDKYVLAFDLQTGCPTVTEVHALTRRDYKGIMVTLKTSMGRRLTVTSDHPVIRHNTYGFDIIPAVDVKPGDQLMALTELPIPENLLAPASEQLMLEAEIYAPIPNGGLAQQHIWRRNISVVSEMQSFQRLIVEAIEQSEVHMTVYSLETQTHTVIVSSGLIAHNCFPKDVKALAYMAQTKGKHPELLQAVMDINRFQRKQIVLKLHELLGNVEGKVVAMLGLSFKENTDDLRESPALDIAEMLNEEGAIVRGYDPVAMENVMRAAPYIHLAEDAYDLARGCDALIVATPWNEFKQLDMARIRDAMKQPVIVDGRNLYDAERMTELGFRYRGVGRGYNGSGHIPQVVEEKVSGE